MFCGMCGSQIEDGAKFCPSCGTSTDGKKKNRSSGNQSVQHNQYESNSNEMMEYRVSDYAKKVFVEPDEELLATLGDGWVVNLLYHRIQKCNALLTNKHLYLQGQVFQGGVVQASKTTTERVLDIRYITGTFFEYGQSIMLLIASVIVFILAIIIGIVSGSEIIAIVLFIPAIMFLVSYFLSRKAYFRIEFGYGFTQAISIDASILGISHVKDFERQVIRAKDRARSEIENKLFGNGIVSNT